MSSTAAAPHALTTPFVPPQNCSDQFVTTSFESSFYWHSGSNTTVSILASGPADYRFAACQPPGWDQGTSSFHFSPAVCPSGWTAYDLAPRFPAVISPATSQKTVWTAHCCSRYIPFYPGILDLSNLPWRGCP